MRALGRLTARLLAFGTIVLSTIWFQWSGSAWQLLKQTEYVFTDKARQLLASGEPENRILVVDIDEASLAAVGPWPWPRHRIADLLELLLGVYRAKAVGLDIVFPSPSPDDQAGDQRLAAMAEYGMVVFAQAFDFTAREEPLQTGVPVFGQVPGNLNLSGPPMQATGFVANHEGLSNAQCVGNIGIRPDPDGRIRRVPLQVLWQGKVSPILPLAMLGCGGRAGAGPVVTLNASGHAPLEVASWEIPYLRQDEAYTVVAAQDILSGVAPIDELSGRWVLVGSSALGLNDRAATPLSAATAGVMVHAALLTALLDLQEGRLPAWHSKASDGRWLATIWILLTVPLLGWVMSRFRAWLILPMVCALGFAWLALALWAIQHQLQFSVLSPLLGYAMVLITVPLEWWLLQREQGQILRSFATYVAPTVLQQMLKIGIEQPMVPKSADITVISADMQNYTGLTGQGSLQDTATLTRGFLQCLTEPLLQQGGTLDKYTGDGLVAFWGAPLPNREHALCAIEAGRQMILAVRLWNEDRVQQGLPPARVRIGIETGPALVGDLGTEFRSTYTAVGDCINLASKLQAAARNLPADLIIGPVAAQLGSTRGDLVPVGEQQLPGTGRVVTLWTIRGLSSSLPSALPPVSRVFPPA